MPVRTVRHRMRGGRKDVTVMEGDLEPRVRRLEDGQRLWFELTNHLRRGQDATNDRLDRIEGDVGQIKTEVDGLTSKVDGLTSKVDGLTSKVDGLTSKVDGLTTDMTELKGQVNRLEVAMARNENNVAAQFEWLRGYIARREQGEP
jgi:outer membrane murein-binding lipoprotein Lpp